MCADERDRIEAAARAIYEGVAPKIVPWDDVTVQNGYRIVARAALAAADAVPAGAGEAVRCTHLYACPCSECVGEEAGEPDEVSAGEAVNPYRYDEPPDFETDYDSVARCWDEGFRAAAGAAEELAAALERTAVYYHEVGRAAGKHSGQADMHPDPYESCSSESCVRNRTALARFRAGGGDEASSLHAQGWAGWQFMSVDDLAAKAWYPAHCGDLHVPLADAEAVVERAKRRVRDLEAALRVMHERHDILVEAVWELDREQSPKNEHWSIDVTRDERINAGAKIVGPALAGSPKGGDE